MSSNYQQKKMMNALGAIDTKGNIVLEQFQSDGSRRISEKSSKRRISHRQNSTCSPSSWAIQGFGNVLSIGSSATT